MAPVNSAVWWERFHFGVMCKRWLPCDSLYIAVNNLERTSTYTTLTVTAGVSVIDYCSFQFTTVINSKIGNSERNC